MQFSSSDISGWASGIIDCGGYSGISISAVSCWLNNSIGSLNLKLGSEYELVSGSIFPEMSVEDMAVYTQMFDCYFLKRAARQSSAFSLTDLGWSKIQGDEQGIIQRSTPSEVAKVYRGLATDCDECLNNMVFQYHRGKCLPTQVLTYPALWDGVESYLPPTFVTRNAILSRFY